MQSFPELSKDFYPTVYLEETDAPLPSHLNPNLRYALFKTIAKGGKCLVQSCKDLNLGRFICYKSLLPELADDTMEQTRFIREARVTAMLQHPNTIPTYELGRNRRGHPYFTMKLVHGYTFREILNFRERYDLTQLLEPMIQVAHALEYAHTHGVAHRDIKPENILVGPYGEVLLLDWGLAKVWHRTPQNAHIEEADEDEVHDALFKAQPQELTMAGKLQGTLCYMSPEQARRDPNIDGRTDLFSLGVILYEILTGLTPCRGEIPDLILTCIKEKEAELPSSLSKLPVPKRLEEITMQCLAKAPASRIESAAELVRALQDVLSSSLLND